MSRPSPVDPARVAPRSSASSGWSIPGRRPRPRGRPCVAVVARPAPPPRRRCRRGCGRTRCRPARRWPPPPRPGASRTSHGPSAPRRGDVERPRPAVVLGQRAPERGPLLRHLGQVGRPPPPSRRAAGGGRCGSARRSPPRAARRRPRGPESPAASASRRRAVSGRAQPVGQVGDALPLGGPQLVDAVGQQVQRPGRVGQLGRGAGLGRGRRPARRPAPGPCPTARWRRG